MAASWRNYWISVAVLAVALPLPGYVGSGRRVALRRPLSELSYEVGDWRGRDEYLAERVRAVLGTDDILLRSYTDAAGRSLGLYVSYFAEQRRGEISHSPKNCLPGAGWQPAATRLVRYPVAGKGPALINEVLYEKNGERQLVFYWFQERGRIVANEYLVKWYLMWDAITRQRSDGALLRIAAPVLDSEEATRNRCMAFMRLALPQLNGFLPD